MTIQIVKWYDIYSCEWEVVTMKIAVSSIGNSADTQVDQRFGRASGFMIFDTEKNEYEYLPNNQVLNLPQGAGIQAAQNVVNANVNAVITGHCGPKAFKVLELAEVDVYLGVSGKVEDIIKQFNEGKLEKASNADVEGHW